MELLASCSPQSVGLSVPVLITERLTDQPAGHRLNTTAVSTWQIGRPIRATFLADSGSVESISPSPHYILRQETMDLPRAYQAFA
jgi:hypothetical protein